MLKGENPQKLGSVRNVETVAGSGLKCSVDLNPGAPSEVTDSDSLREAKIDRLTLSVPVASLSLNYFTRCTSFDVFIGRFDFKFHCQKVIIFLLITCTSILFFNPIEKVSFV